MVGRSGRPVVPGQVLVMALVPFAVPAALTLILVLVADWPRDIAPGSGLKLVGFVATAVTALLVWRRSICGVANGQARRLSALLCGMVGLLAWPQWAVGVMPSVNGAILRDTVTVEMVLERTEATTKRRSPEFDHWAWLAARDGQPGLPAGRYFIPKATYDRLVAEPPATVTVEAATGLLGAVVVTTIQ